MGERYRPDRPKIGFLTPADVSASVLLSKPPQMSQVLEVHTPLSSEEEGTVKLAETCWTRELTFGPDGKVYLVGVKSLFNPLVRD
jgi:hypothetical protein